jgi:predicted dehydrogenase
MEYFLKPRICIIGAGSISSFHIEAAQAAGFELYSICASNNSKRARILYEKYHFKKYLSDTKEIQKFKPDAVSILTDTANLLPIYLGIRSLNVPILIEKPVAKSIDDFPKDLDLDCEQTIVGYNRRFYSSIQFLKSQLTNVAPIQSTWNISELTNLSNSGQDLRYKALRENSIHILDLVMYLFGSIEKVHIERQFDEHGIKFISTLVKFRKGAAATVSINFNIPSIYEGKIFTKNKSFELKPIENIVKYVGINVIEPIDGFSTRLYQPYGPTWDLDEIDKKFKPGFFHQYGELKQLILGGKRVVGASLRDAMNASFLSELLLRGRNVSEDFEYNLEK